MGMGTKAGYQSQIIMVEIITVAAVAVVAVCGTRRRLEAQAEKLQSDRTQGLSRVRTVTGKLLNPAEATANPDSSKWAFNLTAVSGRVAGWFI